MSTLINIRIGIGTNIYLNLVTLRLGQLRRRVTIALDLFQPSIYIAIFPYLFIASFPLFGIVLVSRWIMRELTEKLTKD